LSTRRSIQILIVVLALGLVSSAGATTPGANGRVAFVSTQSGDLELYSIAADGSSLRRLTYTTAQESAPSWSPDGTKIAYERTYLNSRHSIWVMNADGSGQTQITPDSTSADDQDPAWSPDGTKIAFGSTRGGTWNLWLASADGTGLHQITNVFSNDPSWSPDGTKLAYNGLNGIGVVNADGTNPHTISGAGSPTSGPSWSPDGLHIAFVRNNSAGYTGELYVANADGSGETQLTSDGFRNARPAWSPDGTRIVFGRVDGTGRARLWTIGSNGLNLAQLTFGGDDGSPDWSSSQVVPEPTPPDAPIVDIYSPTDGGFYFPGTTAPAFYACFSYSSYIVSCDGDVPFGQPLDLSTWGSHTFTVRAVDGQGRTATKTVTYEVLDITPPLIDLRTPSRGATYELGSNVTVDYSCSDPGGSGVLFCGGDLPDGAPLDTSHTGTFNFRVTAVDNARHIVETHVAYTIVDHRPPTIEIGSPLDGRTYTLGTGLSAFYWCGSPGGFWIVSCNGTVPYGDVVDTSLGTHAFTVTATDENGKTTTTSVHYQVIYAFGGFDSPVDAGGSINAARAGDGIALKFSLSGDQGLNIVTKTTWQTASCADWTPTASATTADAKLTYSASTDRYREIVATSSSWKSTCRILRLELADGTRHDVHVSFR
jgi:hypothetical protein